MATEGQIAKYSNLSMSNIMYIANSGKRLGRAIVCLYPMIQIYGNTHVEQRIMLRGIGRMTGNELKS
jgi:uncharacterized membrane protein YcgQ (UPF0703/DUF1980 family)